MQTGIEGRYKWLEADQDLREFVSLFPAAILGSHIAITAVDSGSFCPSEEDRAAGWTASGGIAYSPRIESISQLPSGSCSSDCGPFDEWYIFRTQPPPFGSICHANVFEASITPPNVFQFINFGGFQLSDPRMQAVTDLFWTQMEFVSRILLGGGRPLPCIRIIRSLTLRRQSRDSQWILLAKCRLTVFGLGRGGVLSKIIEGGVTSRWIPLDGDGGTSTVPTYRPLTAMAGFAAVGNHYPVSGGYGFVLR